MSNTVLNWTTPKADLDTPIRAYYEGFYAYYRHRRPEFQKGQGLDPNAALATKTALTPILHGYIMRAVIFQGDFEVAEKTIQTFEDKYFSQQNIWDYYEERYQQELA